MRALAIVASLGVDFCAVFQVTKEERSSAAVLSALSLSVTALSASWRACTAACCRVRRARGARSTVMRPSMRALVSRPEESPARLMPAMRPLLLRRGGRLGRSDRDDLAQRDRTQDGAVRVAQLRAHPAAVGGL